MRIIAFLGTLLFAYLALIPIGLIGSTLDPACEGTGCSTSLLSDIVFVVMFAATALTLTATAALLAARGFGAKRAGEIVPAALAASFAASAATAFALLAVGAPAVAVVLAVLGAGLYLALRWNRDRERPAAAGPSGNGDPRAVANGTTSNGSARLHL